MKKVLFVCVENSCRSQIAEGIAKHFYSKVIEAYSAGSRPSGVVNPDAIAVMREIGVDISKNSSKGFRDLPTQDFDYVVTLGCKDTCPFFPAKSFKEWEIPDPKGKDIEFFRRTRERLREEIKRLVNPLPFDKE
ncbi:MAG: arsenate reductase ArsC [Candidatus Omnitrophota bacterium]